MNKYLLMLAAAAFPAAAPVAASDRGSSAYSIHFLTSGGQAGCDGLTFSRVPGLSAKLYAGQYLATKCGGPDEDVVGTTTKGAFVLYQPETGFTGEAYAWEISRPVHNGGTFDLYVCLFGTSCFIANNGHYNMGPPAARANPGTSKARIAGMIAQWKAAKQR
jgi:hypothetical protein